MNHVGLLVPAFWGLVMAYFAVIGWSVSKGGSAICAYGAALSAYVVIEGLAR